MNLSKEEGRPERSSGLQRTATGVMPERFGFPIREALWTPGSPSSGWCRI